MKLTNLALLGAIFGPNATSATDAITGINDPLKRKLSSSSSSSSSDYSIASTKSAKFSKASDIDYQATAAKIVAGLGCGAGYSCGDDCYTLNPEAVEALEAIAEGDKAIPVHFGEMVPVNYGFGICDSSMVCQAEIPSAETDQTDVNTAVALFAEVKQLILHLLLGWQ